MIHKRLASSVACVAIAALLMGAGGSAFARDDAAPIVRTPSSPSTPRTTSASVTDRQLVYSFGAVGSDFTFRRREHATPVLVDGIVGSVVQIVASNSDSYALTSTGGVYAWGAGGAGELGDGARPRFVRTATRVQFPPGVQIESLANPMPFDTGLVIDSQGRAWGWGRNGRHQLCLPSNRPVLRPTELPLTDVTLASGAGSHSLLESDGTVYACGQGADGELGDGATADSSIPVAVVGLPAGGVRSLVSSWQNSGALMTDGTYYDWGFNRAGQLGDGSTTNSLIPVRVPLPAAATQVSQGGSVAHNGQTLAILVNGSVWAWGDGRWGQLGDGTAAGSSVPVRVSVPAGVTFSQVSSGGYACYAIDSWGRLWAWGANQFGQLGDGRTVPDQLAPASVGLLLTQVSSTASNVAGFAR